MQYAPKHILAINPGSTSTKIGMFCDEKELFREAIQHSLEQLGAYERAVDQYDMRKEAVLESLKQHGIELSNLNAIVARGAPMLPMHAGAYIINQAMMDVIHSDRVTEHASLVAAPIALEMAKPLGIPAYIYDAVSTDELSDIARISGLVGIERKSICHALNSKAMARRVAAAMGTAYEQMTCIVVHMGGGISVSLHENGRMIDVVGDDEGPFSPERAGTLPVRELLRLCYRGEMGYSEMRKCCFGQGGMVSYLHTNSMPQALERIQAGDGCAELIVQAMIYQIAKTIGSLATVVEGRVDAIILTGGIAHSAYITDGLQKRVAFIAPVYLEPGEYELESLALGALRVLRGEETAREYTA